MSPLERFAHWLLDKRPRRCEHCGDEYEASTSEYRRACSEACAAELWSLDAI